MRAAERIRGANRSSDVPVIRRSAGPGPCVVITAGVHGDELVGFAACHELDRALELSCGEVVLYPALNPAGLVARTRALPDDQGDLNRSFPGDANGTATERHAARIWRDIAARRPAALIDLHADAPTAIPYALVDRAVLPGAVPGVEALALALAAASGLPVLREYPPELYLRFGLHRSLAGAAMNHLGIPSVTLEVGPRRVIDAVAVAAAVRAVRSQLTHLGVTTGEPVAPSPPIRVRGHAPRTRTAGVFIPAVPAGARFEQGERLGSIVGVDGVLLEALHGEHAGIVIAWSEGGWVEAGGIPGTLGRDEFDE